MTTAHAERLSKPDAAAAFYDLICSKPGITDSGSIEADGHTYRVATNPDARYAAAVNETLRTEQSLIGLLRLPDNRILSIINARQHSQDGTTDHGIFLAELPTGDDDRAQLIGGLDPYGNPSRLFGESGSGSWELKVSLVPGTTDLRLNQLGGAGNPTDFAVPKTDVALLPGFAALPYELWAPQTREVSSQVHVARHALHATVR